MEILNKIQDKYQIPLDLYLSLKQQLIHRYDKEVDDLNEFIEKLPQNLKSETAKYVHDEIWTSVKFFNELNEETSQNFLAWMCLHLRRDLAPPY